MKKQIIIYSMTLALLALALQLTEYRFLVIEHSFEIYGGVIALLFTVVGIYAGRKLIGKREVIVEKKVPVPYPLIIDSAEPFLANAAIIEKLGLSKREYEILELLAQGLSNQEIAEQIFVSVNTVKTHTSNLFAKLDVKRRTQAVAKGKELGLIR